MLELEARLGKTVGREKESERGPYLIFTKKRSGKKQCVNHFTKLWAAVIRLNMSCAHNASTASTASTASAVLHPECRGQVLATCSV